MEAPFTKGFDKVVLITGGSKGIGAGCARVFTQAGAKVVICARGRAEGEALAAELNAAGPGTCDFRPCDVAKPDELRAVVEWTVSRHGRLDCLINNAGMHPPHRPIDGFSVEEFRNLLETNLLSYFVAAQAALPHLRKVRGTIVNMSSLVAMTGQQFATIYCATKGGITSFTRALAIDEARNGVRVNSIAPGNILSDSRVRGVAAAEDPDAMDRLIDSWQWPGRSGTNEEAGQAALFLASSASSYITGIELIISGGSELGYGVKAPWKIGLSLPEELYPRPVDPI
jgi:NAD(P)-dependent dehydrogenase (short-subunit alcohol dehydrogenase family)